MRILGIILAVSLSLKSASSAEKYVIDGAILTALSQQYGPHAIKRAQHLVGVMNEIKDANESVKIERINTFFNTVPYAHDIKTWGKPDYWATLFEIVGTDRADCEDYVIAKFFILKELGVDTSKLYFTHVRAMKYKFSSHLVLTYYPQYESVPYVLDNLYQKVLPATQRGDLVVIGTYSSNDLNDLVHSPLGNKLRASQQQTKPFNDLGITRGSP